MVVLVLYYKILHLWDKKLVIFHYFWIDGSLCREMDANEHFFQEKQKISEVVSHFNDALCLKCTSPVLFVLRTRICDTDTWEQRPCGLGVSLSWSLVPSLNLGSLNSHSKRVEVIFELRWLRCPLYVLV